MSSSLQKKAIGIKRSRMSKSKSCRKEVGWKIIYIVSLMKMMMQIIMTTYLKMPRINRRKITHIFRFL